MSGDSSVHRYVGYGTLGGGSERFVPSASAMRLAITPLLLGLLALPLAVHAEEPTEPEAAKVRAAAAEYDAGRRAFNDGDFTSAAAHFENAFRDVPSAPTLRLAIRAQQRAGALARAATLAALALARFPDDSATRDLAQSTLAELAPQLLAVRVRCELACAVVVDRKAVIDEPAAESVLYFAPGTHQVTGTWSEGRARMAEVVGAAGETVQVALTPPEPEAAAAPAPPVVPPESTPRPLVAEPPTTTSPATDRARHGLPPAVALTGLGVTAVVGGITLWSGLDLRKNPGRDAVRRDCAGQDESCPTYQDALAVQRRTNVLIGATGATAAITVVLFTLTDFRRTPRAALAPVLTPTTAGAAFTGSF